MKLSLIGGVPEAQLVAALARARPGTHAPAERNTLAWVELVDAPAPTIAAVQAALGKPLTVIEVELPPGGRGPGLRARRYTVPRTEQVDLTRTVAGLLAEWRPPAVDDDDAPPFDEEHTARELALACAEDVRPPPPPPAIPMGGRAMPLKRKGDGTKRPINPRFEAWATALVEHLRAAEQLDTTDEALPIRRIAALLESHEQDGAVVPAIGDALLELLVDHEAVEEVFADEAELVAAARATRPR